MPEERDFRSPTFCTLKRWITDEVAELDKAVCINHFRHHAVKQEALDVLGAAVVMLTQLGVSPADVRYWCETQKRRGRDLLLHARAVDTLLAAVPPSYRRQAEDMEYAPPEPVKPPIFDKKAGM
jgi:hypothetical protein